MSYKEFIEKQNQIYSNFENSSIKETGTNPSGIVINGTKEYLIALRHSDKVNEKIAPFSERIGKEVPIVEYKAEDLHTTITNHPFEKEEDNLLERLCGGLFNVQNLRSVILYDEWLYNENTVIVKGDASKEFYFLSKEVLNKLKENKIELRMPWGAHITATRFKEKMNPKELRGFFKLMREAPQIGASIPQYIDVGIIHLNKEKFNFDVYRRFELK